MQIEKVYTANILLHTNQNLGSRPLFHPLLLALTCGFGMCHCLLLCLCWFHCLTKSVITFSPPWSIHLSPSSKCLASAAHRPNYTTLDLVDVPLHQYFLSLAIDYASFGRLVRDSPKTHSKAFALSTTIQHSGTGSSRLGTSALFAILARSSYARRRLYLLCLIINK